MNTIKIIGIVLIVSGLLGLAYGGFSYVSDTHRVDLGPVQLQVQEREQVNVPIWAGIAAVVAGGLMLIVGSRRS